MKNGGRRPSAEEFRSGKPAEKGGWKRGCHEKFLLKRGQASAERPWVSAWLTRDVLSKNQEKEGKKKENARPPG